MYFYFFSYFNSCSEPRLFARVGENTGLRTPSIFSFLPLYLPIVMTQQSRCASYSFSYRSLQGHAGHIGFYSEKFQRTFSLYKGFFKTILSSYSNTFVKHGCYCSLNLTGTVKETLTGLPRCFPGVHLGKVFTTRTASRSRFGSVP